MKSKYLQSDGGSDAPTDESDGDGPWRRLRRKARGLLANHRRMQEVWRFPTVLWWSSSDSMLYAMHVTGMLAAIAAMISPVPLVTSLALWTCFGAYSSLAIVRRSAPPGACRGPFP